MKQPVFTGVCTALVTPFGETGKVHFAMLERLIDRQLAAGVRALAVCSATGEAASLSPEERKAIVAHAVRYAAGRCRIIAGTGANSSLDDVCHARDAGADALLIETSCYDQTTQAGLIDHYAAIAGAAEIPILVCHMPSCTGMSISLESYAELSRVENIIGVVDAFGDPALVSRIRNQCRDDLYVYAGCDEKAVPMMAVGAQGLISITANLVPRKFVRMLRACEKGDYRKAGDMQNAFLPLIDAMCCEINPIPVKTALCMAGYDVGPCRQPLCALSRAHLSRLESLLPKIHID